MFILYVRYEDKFKDWKVEGKNVEIINKHYFEMLNGVGELLDQIPSDKEVLVVCAKEGSSHFVADILAEPVYIINASRKENGNV
ncbi:hypothetical protein [Salibacterium salarium]|uniref:hypothetical protein n=1 Tax=Salibacterium salarium TaxID=284579 RepID=UPI000F7B86AE|nr:hypothetical protein [Salibacterium salarium]